MTRAEEHLILSYSRRQEQALKLGKDAWTSSSHLDARAPHRNGPQTETVDVGERRAVRRSPIHVTEADPPPLRADAADPLNGEGVLTIPRPAVDDQHDSAVNVTSLAVFADCPRKYYLQRYIGWNGRFSRSTLTNVRKNSGRGRRRHRPRRIWGRWSMKFSPAKPGSYPAEAQRLARRIPRKRVSATAPRQPARSEREWDFIVDINGTLVRGTIDLWFEENGEIVVVDYKTDTKQRPEAYAPQLALYGLAIERAFGKRPGAGMAALPAFGYGRWKWRWTTPRFIASRIFSPNSPQAQDTLRFDLREARTLPHLPVSSRPLPRRQAHASCIEKKCGHSPHRPSSRHPGRHTSSHR